MPFGMLFGAFGEKLFSIIDSMHLNIVEKINQKSAPHSTHPSPIKSGGPPEIFLFGLSPNINVGKIN